MNNKVIGIVSWLPDINSIRGVRIRRLQNLINQCNDLMKLPIIIIAQNWRPGEIYITPNIKVLPYGKLGITGARQELRRVFLESDYDKLIMLDDDMDLVANKYAFKQYLKAVDEHEACEYRNFLVNLFSISKDLFKTIEFDNISAEKGEGYEDWIFVSKLKKMHGDKVKQINDLVLIRYNRSDLTRDPYSTWNYGNFNQADMTERSLKIINE